MAGVFCVHSLEGHHELPLPLALGKLRIVDTYWTPSAGAGC